MVVAGKWKKFKVSNKKFKSNLRNKLGLSKYLIIMDW